MFPGMKCSRKPGVSSRNVYHHIEPAAKNRQPMTAEVRRVIGSLALTRAKIVAKIGPGM